MQIHQIKLSQAICKELISYVESLSTDKKLEETAGNSNGVSPFISKTNGGVQESLKIRDMNLFEDMREYKILEAYKNHSESGYSNYSSQKINDLISQDIFDYFGLDKNQCKIDVKRFLPGKIHIPHKDYYINYKYSLIDVNGEMQYIHDENKVPLTSKVIRLWITLTEPKFGHILIVENQPLYWLDQGTIVTWEDSELHTAANLGYDDRYIMTITGMTNK
jgi:hypothetical protein